METYFYLTLIKELLIIQDLYFCIFCLKIENYINILDILLEKLVEYILDIYSGE